jgi:hypothetical protein
MKFTDEDEQLPLRLTHSCNAGQVCRTAFRVLTLISHITSIKALLGFTYLSYVCPWNQFVMARCPSWLPNPLIDVAFHQAVRR